MKLCFSFGEALLEILDVLLNESGQCGELTGAAYLDYAQVNKGWRIFKCKPFGGEENFFGIGLPLKHRGRSYSDECAFNEEHFSLILGAAKPADCEGEKKQTELQPPKFGGRIHELRLSGLEALAADGDGGGAFFEAGD